MTHPGRTPAERRILDEVGSGDNCPRARPSTLDKMVADGLLVQLPDRVFGRDALGTISIPQFEMPIPVHYAWCQAMAAECDDD